MIKNVRAFYNLNLLFIWLKLFEKILEKFLIKFIHDYNLFGNILAINILPVIKINVLRLSGSYWPIKDKESKYLFDITKNIIPSKV